MLDGNMMPLVGKTVQEDKNQTLQAKKEKYVANGISALAPIFIEEAKGAIIKDINGNSYIDFYGGIGVINAGHCPEGVVDAIKRILDAAKQAGVKAGIHCLSPTYAKQMIGLGFDLVTLGSDVRIFAAALSSAIHAMRS